VLIVAEGGLGKTRLATDFAAAHGPYALVRTRPSDSAVPYAAFTRALRALAGPAPDLAALPPGRSRNWRACFPNGASRRRRWVRCRAQPLFRSLRHGLAGAGRQTVLTP
jgi:hypothetical protein